MRTKTVKRYYCDFCKKSGGHAGAMRTHEAHCTKNPDRECRVCGHAVKPPEVAKLVPNRDAFCVMRPNDVFGPFPEYPGYREAAQAASDAVREACGNCPACILAVLRQSNGFTSVDVTNVGIGDVEEPSSYLGLFDFKKELEAWWAENSEREYLREKAYL